jgi:hypothetical protein
VAIITDRTTAILFMLIPLFALEVMNYWPQHRSDGHKALPIENSAASRSGSVDI